MGGDHLTFTNNIIDGADAFGLTGYFAASTFQDNTIRNIALIKNLRQVRHKPWDHNQRVYGKRRRLPHPPVRRPRLRLRQHTALQPLRKIGYNGVMVRAGTALEKNLLTQTCYSKADCGAVRTFGDTSLAATTVYNIHLLDNIIFDIPGNVDGCHPSRAAFGMGLYVDNYSRDVETRGNTVISTTISGILYQRSAGQIIGNTVFNASTGSEYSSHIDLGGGETRATITNNALYGLNNEAWTLYTSSLSNFVSSDYNYLFHPYVTKHIAFGPSWTRYSFGDWKTFSGWENHSKTNWFTQPTGEPSRGTIFYNDTKVATTIDLGNRQYLDLDQQPVMGSVTLSPFTSRILIDNGPAPLTLNAISPALSDVDEPTTFTLTARGFGFTANSVLRWNGSARPTTFVSGTQLRATIFLSDVNGLGDFPVTVYDPAPAQRAHSLRQSCFTSSVKCLMCICH